MKRELVPLYQVDWQNVKKNEQLIEVLKILGLPMISEIDFNNLPENKKFLFEKSERSTYVYKN
ncbi:MAG: hypothetical protein ACOCVF_02125 [bacterium]